MVSAATIIITGKGAGRRRGTGGYIKKKRERKGINLLARWRQYAKVGGPVGKPRSSSLGRLGWRGVLIRWAMPRLAGAVG